MTLFRCNVPVYFESSGIRVPWKILKIENNTTEALQTQINYSKIIVLDMIITAHFKEFVVKKQYFTAKIL